MYRMMLLNDGKEYDPVDRAVMNTPYEPREGMVFRFRKRGDRVRADRYRIVRVEVDQEWDDTSNGIAWAYAVKLPD